MHKLYFIAAIALAVIACNKHTPVVSPVNAVSQEDCKNLYTHMLLLAMVNDVDPEFTLSPKDFDGAMWSLDQQWQAEGRREKLYRGLCPQMSQEQMQCAMETSKVGDINACIRFQTSARHK